MKLSLLEGPDRLYQALIRLRPQMVQAAQKAYDEWDPSDEGDPDVGFGGICDQVAGAISGIIAQGVRDVELDDYGWEGDDHAAVVASLGVEKYVVDIPASTYETGSGYAWTKRPGVKFGINDVIIASV